MIQSARADMYSVHNMHIDMTAQNIEKIGMLFPNCITEKVDSNGKIKKAIKGLYAHGATAGQRGMQIAVNGEKLAEACDAELAELTL